MSVTRNAGGDLSANRYCTTIGAICDKFGGSVQTGPFGSQLHAAEYSEHGTPVVMPQDMVAGRISTEDIALVSDAHVKKLVRHQLKRGDVVFSRRGDVSRFAVVTPREEGWLCGTGSIRIRLNSPEVDASYLRHFLQQKAIGDWLLHHARGVTMPNLNTTIVRAIPFVCPPLDEQRRVGAILDEVDALRRKRKRALDLLDSLTRSVFLEMFGDPVTNPRSLPIGRLSEFATFTSGATPSKAVEEFWSGEIPWVSPKDMKVIDIFDAEDHVSETALARTSLKMIEPMAVLLVVRGMILAHTAPLAMVRRAVTINQDMKAIRFVDDVEPEFGFWCLRAQHGHILSKVSSAAHGTKRLEMADVESLNILIPTCKEQRRFVAVAGTISRLIIRSAASLRSADALFSSLQYRAFSGQL